jgi:soluble lytic murein transglycosylase-like protein
MGLSVIAAALLACASNIAPATLEAVVAVESRGASLAIHDDATGRAWYPASLPEAVALAQRLLGAGHPIDLGLMQVHYTNLAPLGLSLAAVFDPCTNIRAGGTILTADYAAAVRTWGDGQEALRRALRAYNTGSFWRGEAYLARFYGPGGIPIRVDAAFLQMAAGDRTVGIGPPRTAAAGHDQRPQIGGNMRRRPSWTAAMIARFSAPSAVYSNQRVPFAIR